MTNGADGVPVMPPAPSSPRAIVASPARLAVAERLRQLHAAFVAHESEDANLTRLAAALDEAIDQLQQGPPRRRSFTEISSEAAATEVVDGELAEHFDVCFVTGPANPCGLAGTVRREGDALVFRGRIPRTFEGMPGFAHGGIVAAIFDDVIGMVTGRLHRISAPTVRLEISFRAPIPLEVEIEVRASLADRDGRKCRVRATAAAGDTVYAEAEGLMVVLRQDQLNAALGTSPAVSTGSD